MNINYSFIHLIPRCCAVLNDVANISYFYTWDVYFETIRDGERREKD